MIRLLLLCCALCHAMTAVAADPARVMLFGTFHFQDPGKDVVQVEDVNVMSDANQEYLDALTDRLAAFKPTVVLLEYIPANEDAINERYRAYLGGDDALGANEIYQLGFRTARKAGLGRVHSFDHREVPWNAQALFEYGTANGSPEIAAFQDTIKAFEEEESEVRASFPLSGLLARMNDPAMDRRNRDLYLLTNAVGVDDGWSGADATSDWWKRNFRMYARIQKHAVPGARIIAIGGQGHMAILKQLLATDQRLAAEDVRPYLD